MNYGSYLRWQTKGIIAIIDCVWFNISRQHLLTNLT